MFIKGTEKQRTSYIAFQFNDKNKPINKLFDFKKKDFWKEDSILLPINNMNIFFDNYGEFLEPTNSPDGSGRFCYYGINFYTKQQTEDMLIKIKNKKPKDYEMLCPWLEQAYKEHNGFFILGI